MSRLPPGIHAHVSIPVVPSVPWAGDPDEDTWLPEVPDQPGVQGERWMVAKQTFPAGGDARILWGAKVDLSIRDRRMGGNTVTVEVPATPPNMRILGLELNEYDEVGRHLYAVDDAVRWELLVGSSLDGLARWRFVVRDEVSVDGGVVTIHGKGIIGGLTSDRVIGAPTRANLLGDKIGSFEYGDLRGWTKVGDVEAGVVSGGIDGKFKVWVTGTPDRTNYLERRVHYSSPDQPWGRVAVASTAYVQLPTALDIDDYGLVTTGVELDDGTVVWPPSGLLGLDPQAGKVTSDMKRGSFHPDPVEGIGRLPVPPYECWVVTRLHPVDEAKRTYFDGVQQIRDEVTSTGTPKDLTQHVGRLFDHAQRGRAKSPWLVRMQYGADRGISETGIWHHSDGQSMPEAIEALCGRGMEVWDGAGPGRRVKVARRRGRKVENMRINPWDQLAEITWRVDPGVQRSALRAQSSANAIWSGADEGAIDTRSTYGQIIDVTVSGPVGMTPAALRAWAATQLSDLRLPQVTSTLVVPWRVGIRLGQGDSIFVVGRSGSAGMRGWQHINAWTPNRERSFVALDLGQVTEAEA